MKRFLAAFFLLTGALLLNAQPVTNSLDNWTLGTNQPELVSGGHPTGASWNHIHLPLGTDPFYYEVMEEGEGTAEFWIHDPGLCLETTNPGYPTNGPVWGLQTPLYQFLAVGIIRKSYIQGCAGYNVWSSVAPYSPYWFMEFYGLRGTDNASFTAGWYKWQAAGTWDDITFTIFDVDYYSDGEGSAVDHGDLSQTVDATSFGGTFEAAMGEGWKAFYLKGDGASGIEDISVAITAGTGVLAELYPPPAVNTPFTRASWADTKKLFR